MDDTAAVHSKPLLDLSFLSQVDLLSRRYRNTRYFLDHPLLVNYALDAYIRRWRRYQQALAIIAGFNEPDAFEDPDPFDKYTYYIFSVSWEKFEYMLKLLGVANRHKVPLNTSS